MSSISSEMPTETPLAAKEPSATSVNNPVNPHRTPLADLHSANANVQSVDIVPKTKNRSKKTSSSEPRHYEVRLQVYVSLLRRLNGVAKEYALSMQSAILRLKEQMAQGSASAKEDIRRHATAFEIFRRFYDRHSQYIQEHYKPNISNSLWIWGSGECSQLGTSATKATRPKELDLTRLKGVPLKQLSAGGLHTLILREDGRILSCGCNDDGALGRDTDPSSNTHSIEEYLPHFVDTPIDMGPANRVSCGDCQSLAVTNDGRIYTWGSYRDTEGNQFRDVSVDAVFGTNDSNWLDIVTGKHTRPVCLNGLQGKAVRDVKCGASFNAAVTDTGELFTWGIGRCGELARPPPTDEEYRRHKVIAQYMLTPLPPHWADGIARKVESVACGGYHILVTTVAGYAGAGTRVFSAGLNKFGQLGLNDLENRSALTRIEALDRYNVHRIAAGLHHSLCTDQNGNLVAFGRGDYGQLGITRQRPEGDYFEPRPVRVALDEEDDSEVVQISCGGNHNLAITSKGSVYSWGFGSEYALGHGFNKDEYRPKKLALMRGNMSGEWPIGLRVHQVAAGGQHSAMLCERKAE